MRLPIALLLLLAVPAPASAGTVALVGTELVFRDDPGADTRLTAIAMGAEVPFSVRTGGLAAGAGCTARSAREVRCPTAGVTAVRLEMGDGDDGVAAGGPVPLLVDLGEGDDTLIAGAELRTIAATGGPGDDWVEAGPSVSGTLLGGPGRDELFLDPGYGAPGPYLADGGPDADRISLGVRAPGTTLAGGDGDDELEVLGDGRPVTISCGAGLDRWSAGPRDVLGDGCAPHVAGITRATVSRAFREGSLTAPAGGSVTFRRRVGDQGRPREIIARGTFTAGAGALRVSLAPTRIGRRWLRREPRLPVFVSVRTRSPEGERGEVTFRSRIR